MRTYSADLAYIHDVGFGDFARKAAPWILDLLRHCGITSGLTVELGCGSGIMSRELACGGYEVLGIDQSAAILKIARARTPQARFRRATWSMFNVPPCVAVIAIGEVLCYQLDSDTARPGLVRLFQRVYSALRPGGVFVFDIAGPGRGAAAPQKHYSGPDWAVLLKVEEDQKLCRLTRHMTMFRKVGRGYRRSEEIHELQLYRGQDIARQLRDVGFRVKTIRAYGKKQFPTGLVGFIACRPM